MLESISFSNSFTVTQILMKYIANCYERWQYYLWKLVLNPALPPISRKIKYIHSHQPNCVKEILVLFVTQAWIRRAIWRVSPRALSHQALCWKEVFLKTFVQFTTNHYKAMFSPLAPWGLELAVRRRQHSSKRTFQVLQAPIYQDKIIHYLIRREMSPSVCVCVWVSVSECGDMVRKQGEQLDSDVRRCNEAARQRLSKLVGETGLHSANKLLKFFLVLQGKVTMKQGSVRPSDCCRAPLISCLKHPLQVSLSDGPQQSSDETLNGGRQCSSKKNKKSTLDS